METKNIVLIVLVGISIASCTQTVAQKQQHQIETVSELFDTLANRGMYGQRVLTCTEDSFLHEEYLISHYVPSNEDPNGSYDKEWFQRDAEEHKFLLQTIPELLDRLCKTAEKSYRYMSYDSLNYNITMGTDPQEYIVMNRWKDEQEGDWFDFSCMVNKPVNITLKSDDVKSVQELLKKFLAEQNMVEEHEVKYEWDSGVDIPNNSDDYYATFLPSSFPGHGSDSLAASSVTGTHYFIPAKDDHRINVAVDLYNRLIRIVTEQPRRGTLLSTFARFKEYLERGDWCADILRYSVYDYAAKRRIYYIMMEQSPEGIHILELNTADVTRFAIPRLWLHVTRTHNLEIIREE